MVDMSLLSEERGGFEKGSTKWARRSAPQNVKRREKGEHTLRKLEA
jgi:hypothetical protein